MSRIGDSEKFRRATELARGWLIEHCLGDRELDEVDQEFLKMAAEGGAFAWLIDIQQHLNKEPLSPELAVAYEGASKDMIAGLVGLGIYQPARTN